MAGKVLPADSYGLMVSSGFNWDSRYSYYLGRKLKLLEVDDLTMENLRNFQNQGYSFLVVDYYRENKEYLAKKIQYRL